MCAHAMQCTHDVIAHATTHGMMWHDSHCVQINQAPQFMHMTWNDVA